MRRVILAVLASALLLTGCGAKDLVVAPNPSDINVATPDLVALKAKSSIPDCPRPQVRAGALPKATVKCLGGGTDVDLSTLKGPLIINFWQSACIPCRQEMPALEDFHRQYPQVAILGVDTTDTLPGVAIKQATKRGITYPLVADPGGDLQTTKLHIRGTPAFWMLSADGRLSYHIGGLTSVDEVKQMVEQEMGVHL
ncbi:TlpA disulfide reductase family protein [Nocardioides sp. BP30]|uniref:TlpA family protein disulfide reductase n=1 Tax=Nocardioides sp. BP30 TaxID=3036374 RepID=UPI002468957A|nr:TlpA disulfide reductase family protein [Nocardioides sp. BP30]WGL52791.1 TlpA disulfide reductase family protein [Nocardioides sp. BP30]